MRGGSVEAFHASSCRRSRSSLEHEEFDTVLEARVVIADWLVEYNTIRPHRGLGMLTPAGFAASCRKGPK